MVLFTLFINQVAMDSRASPLQYYDYKPLPPQHIRILTVDMDPYLTSPDSISCSLRIVSTTCNSYHCLSYTWEDPFGYPWATAKKAATRHVICDGQWIDVTANLFDALSTLRRCIPIE